MKVTDVKTVLLTSPSTLDPFLREVRKLRSVAFIEVYTDEGLTGLGETYAGYFCPEIVPQIVDFYKPILLGQGVDDIGVLWNRMYQCGNFWGRVGVGVAVLNGIEAALWDLKGKASGVPVYELLGGLKHESLACYATGGPSNYPKDRLAAKIDHYRSLGFRALKVATGSYSVETGFVMPSSPSAIAEFEVDKLEFMGSYAGQEMKVMLDGHMGNSPVQTWDLQTALVVLKALEPYDLIFFEEPLHYTDPWGYAELCRSTSIPVAGGECLTASYEWRVFCRT